jgi:hypothetical protein
MKMFARLRYLIEEGFEVPSISGYDDDSGNGNAKLMFVEVDRHGLRRLRSEIFDVSSEEMERCSDLFLEHHSRRDR